MGAVTYIIACIIAVIYGDIKKKELYIKQIKLSKVQWFVIIFWLINVISCFMSPFFKEYNLFVGVGRGEGLINITLYCITFLFITLFGKFRKRFILYFSISSILLNLICILQYIGFNPLNMYQDGIGTHNVSFMGTIGNKDFISALYCILLMISVSGYVFGENKKYENVIHLTSIFMGFFILEILSVLSGFVGIFFTLIIISPYIITNSKRLSKTLIVGSLVLLAYAVNIIINPTYYYSLSKLKLNWQFNIISGMLIFLAMIFIGLAQILKKRQFDLSKNKKTIKIIYIVIASIILVGVLVLYFVDFNYGMLYEVHQLLNGNFDDDFGTYRIFLWKRAITLIKEYPIIGTGPDTFAIRFMSRYTEDVAKLGELTINDTAANVYITMAVNIGMIGLLRLPNIPIWANNRGNKK